MKTPKPKPGKIIIDKPLTPMQELQRMLTHLHWDLRRVEHRVKLNATMLRRILKHPGNPADLQPSIDRINEISQAQADETAQIHQALDAQKVE